MFQASAQRACGMWCSERDLSVLSNRVLKLTLAVTYINHASPQKMLHRGPSHQDLHLQ